VRAFDDHEGAFEAALLTTDSLFVAGFVYDPLDSQQPMFGDIELDGTWRASMRPLGSLENTGEYEAFTDVVRTDDGGFLLAGYTRSGVGSCDVPCDGTDALAVRLRPDRSVMWASAVGYDYADDSVHRIVRIPGGDFILLGGGRGQFDYSLGLGTDIDGTPSMAYRIDALGNVVWQRELRLPSQRGGRVDDAVFDPASGQLVISGSMGYGRQPFFAEMALDGTITRAFNVSLGVGDGEVSSIVLADDGGLFIAGYELQPPQETTRHIYVARLDPSRTSAVWAFRSTTGYSGDPLRMIRSMRGDLVVAIPSAGSSNSDVIVARVDGGHAGSGCWPTSPASLTISPLDDNSVAATYTSTALGGAPLQVLPGIELRFPSSPAPASRCTR
jgi:hypothetical protein